ncbi:MAG: ribonuclease R [candidate division Zixibacteria bacterium]|nr:ribonuclease R [candidate division Zixibacteria bacterium]
MYDTNQILDFIKSPRYQPIKRRALAKKMGVKETSYPDFRMAIRDLMAQGSIIKLKGGRLGLPDKQKLVTGKLSVTRGGFGFVIPEEKGDDIFVGSGKMNGALHGDKVLVTILSTRGKSPEGAVLKILERSRLKIIGTYREEAHASLVEPDSDRFPPRILISAKESKSARPGQKVVVEIFNGDKPDSPLTGRITEILGYPEDSGVDILSVIRRFDLPDKFPPEVKREAEKIPSEIPASELERREDFSGKVCFTIDPADAKDHDDAVSLEILPNGNYLLGVHIADVSQYVPEKAIIDNQAQARATSIYLVDRVIPMLPERLSNEICSLKPNQKRLTYSCMMELDLKGKMHRYEIKESFINSRAKLNYNEVQEFFDTGKSTPSVRGFESELTRMLELSKILLKEREKKGSLDFDLPEAKVVFDKEGKILDIFEAARLGSHRLIEEFMLLANKTVALHVARLSVPFVYRVHDRPDEEKMDNFREMVNRLGYQASLGHPVTPRALQTFLDRIQGRPEEELINEILLRSLKKAVYQVDNIGHFGLAFTHYTHFTSPIRRYPDLIVHRLLKELSRGKYSPQRYQELSQRLPVICKHSSERERQADEAERETLKVKQVEFLQDKAGEVYPGIVSGVMNFGFFVRLEKSLAEGLVRYSDMEDDYYHYDEENYQAVGKKHKRRIRLGDELKVRIVRVDLHKKQIDFMLLPEEGKRKPKSKKR